MLHEIAEVAIAVSLVVIAIALSLVARVVLALRLPKLRKPLALYFQQVGRFADYKLTSDKLGDNFMRSLEEAGGLHGREPQQRQTNGAPVKPAEYAQAPPPEGVNPGNAQAGHDGVS